MRARFTTTTVRVATAVLFLLGALVVLAPSADATSGFVSDEFTGVGVGAHWQVVDPVGDGTVTQSGDGVVELAVPAGESHDAWGTNRSLRIMQTVSDADIELVAVFETLPDTRFQTQGLLIEQDAGRWLRFDTYHDGKKLRAFAASTTGGKSSMQLRTTLGGLSGGIALRVVRSGDSWTMETGPGRDGPWELVGGFDAALTMNQAGVFAANHDPSPSFTARVDLAVDPTSGGEPQPQPPAAVATADPTAGSAPLTVSFDGSSSTDADGTIVSHDWDFGDGSTASGAAIDHEYSSVGDYLATLTVTDDDGLTDTDTIPVTVREDGAVPWWSSDHAYRIPISVSSDTPLHDRVALVEHDFAPLLGGAALEADSLRLVEHVDGHIVDPAVPFQFDPAASFDAVTDPRGTVALLVTGSTTPGTERTYHLYADSEGGVDHPAPPVVESVGRAAAVLDEGQDSYRIETPAGDWTYHRLGGGFSSLDDVDGNDWISYSQAAGTAGAFRGIPNLVHPEGHFHPGATSSSTTLVHQGPLRVALESTTADGWAIRWDIYPTYATATVLSAPQAYWFLYEGTPGGTFEGTDTVTRSGGVTTPLSQNWTLDLNDPEWAYFTDATLGRSLWVTSHAADAAVDSYRPANDEMTVFGFGRDGVASGLTGAPRSFSVGLADGTDAEPALLSASAALTSSIGEGEARPASGSAPSASALATPNTGTAPLVVDFDASRSTDPDGTIVSYEWDFGDGQTTAGAAATHTFATPGSYEVALTVTDDAGATDIDHVAVVVAAGAEPLPDEYSLTTSVVGSGSVSRNPDGSSYPVGTDVELSASAATGWTFAGWEGDVVSSVNPLTVTMDQEVSVTARFVEDGPPPPASSFVSDDFDQSALGSQWTIVDPLGDGTVDVVGAGSGDATLRLSVPAGTSHDPWNDNRALRVMQPVGDEDLELEVGFQSVLSERYQTQGLLFEQDELNWLRFGVYHDGSRVRAFAASTVAGSSSAQLNQKLGRSVADVAVRVARAGDQWTMSVSTDRGATWQAMGTFDHALTLARAGVYSGNHDPSPAFTAVVDYVFDTAAPIVPEDGGSQPSQHTLTTSVIGSGSVERDPDAATYATGTDVTLTATPAPGWQFDGWEGDVVSVDNPLTLTITDDASVTARFLETPGGPAIQQVSVDPAETTATVSWTTDVPTTGLVEYGETTAYELGTATSSTLGTDHQVTLTGLAAGTAHHMRVVATDEAGQSTSSADVPFTTDAPPGVGPSIDVWHGDALSFGSAGVSQPWINVLGNVSDPDGVATLHYQVNGGSPQPLAMGGDSRRLDEVGDFNVEIDRSTLPLGQSTITLVAVDGVGASSSKVVSVHLSASDLALPYTIDWASTSRIDAVAQVVDGHWTIDGAEVRLQGATALGYDRLIALGDSTWTDYEVTTSMRFEGHGDQWGTSQSGTPLIGLGLRWQGHTNEGGEQPSEGFYPVGAYTWFRWDSTLTSGRYSVVGNQGAPHDRQTGSLVAGDTVMVRARVETVPGGTAYSVRYWAQGSPEPANWTVEIVEDDGPASGSIALIAHHSDVRFGDIDVQPLTVP